MASSTQIEQYRNAVAKRFLRKLKILTQSELNKELSQHGISFDSNSRLGTGSYGVVFAGEWVPMRAAQPRQIVIKQQLDKGAAMEDPTRIIREIEISYKIKDHPHLAMTYQTFGPIINDLADQEFTEDQLKHGLKTMGILLVLERYHGGDLIGYVADICGYSDGKNKLTRQSPAFIKCVMGQILEAVRFLFSEMISHRDLAARNIMFDKHGTVKVIDYGLAWDLSKGLPEASAGSGHSSSDSGSDDGSSTPVASGSAMPVSGTDSSKTASVGADLSKTPTPGADGSKTPVAESSDKDDSKTPTEDTFNVFGVLVKRSKKSSRSDGSRDTVTFEDKTSWLTSIDKDSGGPNMATEGARQDTPLTAQEARELKESIEEDLTPTPGGGDLGSRTPVAIVEKSELLHIPKESLTPKTKQDDDAKRTANAPIETCGKMLHTELPKRVPLRITPKTEKLMKNWNVSDQDKRYPGGAQSPDPVEDEAKFMRVHKDWAEMSFCKDLKMVSLIILFMLLDNDDHKLSPKLSHIMMARFYLFIRRSAVRFAENRQNPMQDILDHPFLVFDPIQMYFQNVCSNVID